VSDVEAELQGMAQALERASPRLSTLDALILAAVALDLAADSRSLANAFGIGHALVLRAVGSLGEEPALLSIAARDARTQRCFLTLAPGGEALVAAVKALN